MTFNDVLEIKNGKNQRAVENPNGKYPIYGSGGIMGRADDYICDAGTVIIGRKGSINNPIYVDEPFWNVDTAFGLQAKKDVLLPRYLYYFCVNYDFERHNKAVTIPSLTKSDLLKIKIDLPAIEAQQAVVDVLSKVESIIELRKNELQKLTEMKKARFAELFGHPDINEKEWKVNDMDQLCEVSSSKRIYQNEQSMTGIPFLRISDLVNRMDAGTKECDLHIPKVLFEELKDKGLVPSTGDILLTARGTLGRCYIVQEDDEFYFQDGMITWLSKFDSEITPLYISCLFEMPGFRKQIDELQAGSTVAYLSISMTKKLKVMVPPVELQNQFADFVHQVDKSKAAVQKSLDETQVLFDSLMQKYFG